MTHPLHRRQAIYPSLPCNTLQGKKKGTKCFKGNCKNKLIVFYFIKTRLKNQSTDSISSKQR